jgi:hypothetical protein
VVGGCTKGSIQCRLQVAVDSRNLGGYVIAEGDEGLNLISILLGTSQGQLLTWQRRNC